MMVMTMSLKHSEPKTQTTDNNQKSEKSLQKCRPITATLEHPLILDMKLLQKLDMTTFTKRSLIALSKFCGISLISKNGSKTKLNQCLKAIQSSYKLSAKKSSGSGNDGNSGSDKKDTYNRLMVPKEQTISDLNSTEGAKSRRMSVKPNIVKNKSQEQFKFVEVETGQNSGGEEKEGQEVASAKEEKAEEDFDVICGNGVKMKVRKSFKPKNNYAKKAKENVSLKKKAVIKGHNSVMEIVPEPCKSCTRPQQPERLHSHPKNSAKGMERKRFEEKYKASTKKKENDVETNNQKGSEKTIGKNKNICSDNNVLSPQKSVSSFTSNQKDDGSVSTENNKSKKNSGSCAEVDSTTGKPKSEETKIFKKTQSSSSINKPQGALQTRENGDGDLTENKKLDSRGCNETSNDSLTSTAGSLQSSKEPSSDDDSLNYITGCYICGAQVPPQMRVQHERECIGEWRTQNSVLPPEERKPEPKRPDYRFTGSGNVDLNGTFESIWANHMDSLVPCKFCSRKFFPDRIERHENCCNNLSLRLKFRH